MSSLSALSGTPSSYLLAFQRATCSLTPGADVNLCNYPGSGILGEIIAYQSMTAGVNCAGCTLNLTVDGVLVSWVVNASGVSAFSTSGPFIGSIGNYQTSTVRNGTARIILNAPFKTSLLAVLHNSDAVAKSNAATVVLVLGIPQ